VKKGRVIALSVLLAVAIAVIAVLTFGNQGFLDMYRLYRMDRERAVEIAAAQSEIDSLRAEIERLKNDTAYIEWLARERLGMARRGERVFIIVEDERSAADRRE
jgi:cell division protein FtsB